VATNETLECFIAFLNASVIALYLEVKLVLVKNVQVVKSFNYNSDHQLIMARVKTGDQKNVKFKKRKEMTTDWNKMAANIDLNVGQGSLTSKYRALVHKNS